MRIEVGYGLEGTLTDALSSVIISSAMVPRFKANDFSTGIERGVDGIISVLSGDTADWQPEPSVRAEDPRPLSNGLFTILFVLIAIFVIWSLIRSARGTPSGRYVRRGGPRSSADRRFAGLVRVGRRFGRWRRWVWRGLFRWRRLVGWRWRVRKLVGPMVEFTKEDYEVVSAAIREAEKRTSGQIVCVLAHSSSGYAYVPILWASVLALAAPWPLIEFTQWSVQRIFALQVVVFIVAGFLVCGCRCGLRWCRARSSASERTGRH